MLQLLGVFAARRLLVQNLGELEVPLRKGEVDAL